jgi:ABC-type polysaccharide/polyol phosphate transport system ATPase subunit
MERIVVDNISKKFFIGFRKQKSALERFVSVFSGIEDRRSFWVLKNVSFKASAGEVIGIIGKNGSGKSTLLRTIAGIYTIDNGNIKTAGKIISMIRLSDGFKDRLTMKENIYLCCYLFGLDRNKIKKRFHRIVAFAELDQYIQTKIYQFSEGMRARLAFSIAIACDPDILLLDEFLAVGDESYKNKALGKIEELINSGKTVLLTTHFLEDIEDRMGRECDKVIWLDRGSIIAYGDSESVKAKYMESQ